jgi:hypothetical protein
MGGKSTLAEVIIGEHFVPELLGRLRLTYEDNVKLDLKTVV